MYTRVGNGYKDTVRINNGARGDGDTVTIAGGRIGTDDVVSAAFIQGIFLLSGAPVENFSDRLFSNKDFLSLTALGYATSVALPRLQLSGTFDLPSSLDTAPLVITYGGVSYWVDSFEFDTKESELRVTAVSLPAANLSVESETVTELADSQGTGTPGSGFGSASGTVINTIVESKVSFGPTGNSKTILSVNGESRTLLLEGWTELPAVGSSDNGKVLKVVSGAWAKGTDSGYVKPSTGIPSSDMAAAGQTSLGKADSALQAVPSDYKKVVLLASESDMPASPDSDTLYLIPET